MPTAVRRCVYRFGWALLLTSGLPHAAARAQAAAVVPAAPRTFPWPTINVRFRAGKPVLGMLAGSSRGRTYCSPEGDMFFSVSGEPDGAGSSGTTLPALYRLKDSGEVRAIGRTAPPTEFTDVSVRDFYAAEHDVATLLQAEIRSDGDPNLPPRETRYFVSLSDHDGDAAKLIPLDIRFRPNRIAVFGSGDFLVLGWDTVNLLPVLALVKDDGTVRRFFDMGSSTLAPAGKPAGASSLREMQGAAAARSAEEMLQRAVFVPFGPEVLLTFPGTAKALQVWNPGGDSRNIPIALPSGFVLHDVVESGRHWTVVVRAEEEQQPGKEKKPADKEADKPQQRLFEMNSTNGALIREFLIEKPTVRDVTCAVNPRLTAVFLDTMDEDAAPGTGQSSAGDNGATQPKPTHLVVATSLR